MSKKELLEHYQAVIAESKNTIKLLTGEMWEKTDLSPDITAERVKSHTALIATFKSLIDHIKQD